MKETLNETRLNLTCVPFLLLCRVPFLHRYIYTSLLVVICGQSLPWHISNTVAFVNATFVQYRECHNCPRLNMT